MTPERWRRVEELYDAAVDKTTHDRAVFLAEACPGDVELQQQIEKLIRRGKTHSPLDVPAWKLLESSEAPPGTEMGPYRIVELIGAGGMGRVYKAIDTRLGRTVAIKVSKSRFSERFRDEARAISALNHANICTLYDVGPNYQVMEYVEGAPLKGPMTVEKALPIAIAVAGALSAAHRAGVVHCDLKPGNILLAKSGPKLLDFGLARLDGGGDSNRRQSGDPGAFAGTFPYMAPEQRQGGTADVRSDIFAFGVTLFEVIAGHLPRDGSMRPEWPPALQHVIARCLAPDPDARWQSIRDVQSELEWIASQASAGPASRSKLWARVVAAAGLIAAGAVGGWLLARRPPPAPLVRFTIPAPAGTRFAQSSFPLLSPDARHLIFVTTGQNYLGQRRWLHDFGTGEDTPMDGAPPGVWGPWSPASDSVLVYSSERLLKFDLSGARTEVLREPLSSVTWAPDGSLIFGIAGKGLFVAPKNGERRLIVPKSKRFANTTVVQALEGGRILFWALQPTLTETWIAGRDGQTKMLMSRPARYAAPGYLLYQQGDSIMAQPFHIDGLQLAGEARTLLSGVAHDLLTSVGNFTIAENGTLVFLRDRPIENNRIQIFNRAGQAVEQAADAGDYVNPALSPDGHKLAVAVRSPALTRDIWVLDLNRRTRERISTESPDNNNPTWSPDGSQIAFSAERGGIHEIHVRSASGNGPERVLQRSDFDINPLDWSRDGRFLIYNSGNAQRRRELWALPFNPEPGTAFRLMETRDSQNWARISPNGRWLLYRTFDHGRSSISLTRFPPGDQTWQVSTGNNRQAEWRGDGREIYFDQQGSLMAVALTETAAGPSLGPPHGLFALPVLRFDGRDWYTVSPDGSRFFIVTTQANAEPPLEVVVNWPRLLDGK